MTAEGLRAYLNTADVTEWPMVATGHPAPDTDAVISALFEGWRRTLAGEPCAPLVQTSLPRETAWLLGEFAPLLTVGEVPAHATLVLTDHHDLVAYQNPVAAVVDHHPVTPDTDLTGIETEVGLAGSATTLVAGRIRRDGHTPDPVCARILLGAILMDTEGLSDYKAKVEDVEIAYWLYTICAEDMPTLFANLKEQLLSETDVTALYRRDYRLYTDSAGQPYLGWAILKVWEDACPDLNEVRRLLAEDTAPTRVAKVVLNSRQEDWRKEWYLAAGVGADTLLTAVCEASGEDALRADVDVVYLPATCHHWGRKRYAARLAGLLGENN